MKNSIKQIAKDFYHKIWCKVMYHIKLEAYWLTVPQKVKKMRKKETIKVLFIVSEAASWKSELLYVAMLKHPRFFPILGISTSHDPEGAKMTLESYLKSKRYNYIDLDSNVKSIKLISPDIVFYYKPYRGCYSQGHFFNNNLNCLFCGLDYCIEVTKHAVHIEKELFDYCWQFYVEHQDIARRRKEVLGYRSRNTIFTGVPIQDVLLLPKGMFNDPWRDNQGKKRIIYAPHHSIKGTNGNGIEFSTFLDYGEGMLLFAKKYCKQVSIAFKPHPNLYKKLVNIWGKDKTDSYYNEWETLPNTQIETGEYIGLFKYSDAIIHDSASFIVEYLFMDKPAMYLVSKTNNIDEMFDFVKQGFNCYEHGSSINEIESFIIRVIEGNDNNSQKRREYIKTQLLPPNGGNACDNIISAILGC